MIKAVEMNIHIIQEWSLRLFSQRDKSQMKQIDEVVLHSTVCDPLSDIIMLCVAYVNLENDLLFNWVFKLCLLVH